MAGLSTVLTTPRLRLRPLTRGDAAALSAYRSDPAVARYQPWTVPFTVQDAENLITALVESDPLTPGWFQYGIERRADAALIGDLGVHLHANGMQAEIGFTLSASEQGQGYGSEAVRRILEHLLVERRLHKVAAECDARNEASARLLTRVGFTLEGRLRSQTFLKGEWTDDLWFGVLADEWPPA
ncbi:GNAT family N-acetyltransferase [Nakamurella sp. GG22]